MKTVGIILLAILAATATQADDMLALQDGDTLTGSFIEVAEGTVIFRTAYAGLTILPVSEVKWIHTDTYYAVINATGEEFTGRFGGRNGAPVIYALPTDQAIPLDLTTIVQTSPVEFNAGALGSKPSYWEDTEGGSASLEFGWRQRWTQQEYGEPFARLELEIDEGRYYFIGLAEIELADGSAFPSYARGGAEWRFDSPFAWEPELGLGIERDTSRALAFRGEISTGLSREFLAEGPSAMRLSSGILIRSEHYNRSLLNESSPRIDLDHYIDELFQSHYYARNGVRRDDVDLDFFVRLRYSQHLFRGTMFHEELRLIPSLTRWGHFRASSESAVEFPVSERLSLRLNLLVDYNREPGFSDLDRWATSVGAGIAWGF